MLSYYAILNLNKPVVYEGFNTIVNRQFAAATTSRSINTLSLPKQPVPSLEKTAERYLKSLKPLLRKDEYSNTEKIVKDFISEKGIGVKLQTELLKRFNNTSNWMSEWWLQVAYLGYRLPVIVNSSPGTVGPHLTFKTSEDIFRCSAHLISAVCQYDKMIKSGQMKQEMARNMPLDMQPYGLILGSYRRSCKEVDRLLHTDHSNHVIIINNNHFFKLPIHSKSGEVISAESLMASIKDIVSRSQQICKPVGILTGNDRDTWSEDYRVLKDIGSNGTILKDIENSLFILCLETVKSNVSHTNKNWESIVAKQSLTGSSSTTNSGNRWHDKTVQFIISHDGFLGMEYEHSPCEALPIAVLFDFVLKYIFDKQDKTAIEASNQYPIAEHLKFEVNDYIEKAIANATDIVDKISEDIDMECFKFNEFGTNAIKNVNLSPDSFIQIAMQLTFYKLHGKPPVHYESAALRRFQNARTECIRSTSSESVQFCMVMNSLNSSSKEKKETMLAAINKHKIIANEAAMGEGIDRHLFGLKMIAKEANMDLPKLFSDVGYTKSTHYTLTSSQVPYKTASFMCYGPVVPEGYGCCYNPRPNDIFFACSSFNSCLKTNTKSFANEMKNSLCNMLKLVEA